MKKSKFIVVGLLIIASSFCQSVAAYEVIEKGSAKIDDTHTFYFITYAFGHEKYDFSLPGLATRGHSENLNAMVYTLRTPEGLTIKDGKSVAKIFSNTKRLENQFIAPAGTSTRFTLAVLHEKSNADSRANTLTVDSLRFLIGDHASELKPHELKAYSVSATGTPKVKTDTEN